MTRTSSLIPGYTSRHCDGTPGLEYFQDGFAFAWSGKPEDLIEVSPGAYSEPVEWIIPTTPLAAAQFAIVVDAHAPWLLGHFRYACDQWLAWNGRRNRPDVAHRRLWSRALKAEICDVCLVDACVIPRDLLETFGNYLPAQWEDCEEQREAALSD
ncbi:hypothetical protein SAMN05428985_11537 [Nocardioides sp. YR527]|uniref:hypothetical protein n=1 Tax=Nocardioides sp. YR527 TaxID=1881028 RepID=UPI00088501C6|nr:hypothetical protein [Nocardioides sp. YR527]SDL34208.1 hypothetical protein SAMN05428985_11537 [Nocardioides sp. YR527]